MLYLLRMHIHSDTALEGQRSFPSRHEVSRLRRNKVPKGLTCRAVNNINITGEEHAHGCDEQPVVSMNSPVIFARNRIH
jgi:hypothetical protein